MFPGGFVRRDFDVPPWHGDLFGGLEVTLRVVAVKEGGGRGGGVKGGGRKATTVERKRRNDTVRSNSASVAGSGVKEGGFIIVHVSVVRRDANRTEPRYGCQGITAFSDTKGPHNSFGGLLVM